MATTCSQALAGIARDCAPSMGGVKQVLIANYSDVATRTLELDKINAISMASEAKFKRFEFKRGTSSMTSTLNVDATASNYVSTDLVLGFTRMETSKRVQISALAVNDLVVLVQDSNDVWWYLGYDEPVNATAGEGVTGTARADKNGYGITLQDNAKTFPYEVDGSIIDALVEK